MFKDNQMTAFATCPAAWREADPELQIANTDIHRLNSGQQIEEPACR